MARTDNSALTTVQQLLSAVCGYAVPNIRSADDFCAAFPPELIMERIEDAELRANILYATAGTRIEVARRTSKESAGEQMKIALAEKLVAPEVVLELLSPDHRVQYLDAPALWAFVAEKKIWKTHDGPNEVKAAKGLIILILETALKLALVSPEEIVRAIGFASFFEKEPKQRLVDSFEAYANAEPGNGFLVLLGRHTPTVIVENVALDVIWERAIHPLLAVRNGFDGQTAAGASAKSASQASLSPAPSARAASPMKRESTIPGTGGAVRPSAPAVSPVSSVPPASRISSGSQASQESDNKDPKAREASEQQGADADDMVVGDDDIIAASVMSDATETDGPTLSWNNDSPQISIGGVPSASKTGSPANAQLPRPKSDVRRHPTGDVNVEMVVEQVSMSDPDIRAALREEPAVDSASIPSTRSRSNTGSFGPDSALARAAGANRSASITPVSSKTAVYDLLRSGDSGLKLATIDPSTCRIHQLMIAALEEIDPGSYGGAHQRFSEANKLDLGNILCSEIETRNTRTSARLRQILGNIGCATKIASSSAPSSIRPPPLPPSKAPPSSPGSSEQRISQVPPLEKKQ